MKRFIISVIFVLIFASCEELKDIAFDDFDVTKIECRISGVTYEKDDTGNYIQITQNSDDCPVGTLCNGNNCVESKCTASKIQTCKNDDGKRCEPLSGNCIIPPDYCSLLDEEKQKEDSCGKNGEGSQRVICDNWRWINNSSCIDIEGNPISDCSNGCIDNSVCINDENQNGSTVCGKNNEGFIVQKCENGQWVDTEECTGTDVCVVNDIMQDIPCGFNGNGKQNQKCESGQWINQGNCDDSDICINGEKKTVENSCGPENSGTQKKICVNGQWENDSCNKTTEYCKDGCIYNSVCGEGDLRNTDIVCGFNNEGIEREECQDGQWVNNGNCSGTDICANGEEETRSCGFNNRGFAFANCVNGQWNIGVCDDDEVCVDDSLGLYELCGFNNNGYVQNKCVIGQWNILNQPCNPVQSKMIGNDYTDESNIILRDENNNNIYIVANLNCDGNSENCHYKIYKYDNNLTLLKQSSESIETGKIKSAVLDGNGGIIIVGYNYNNNRNLLIEKYETTNLTRTHFGITGTLQEDILTDVYVYQNEYYAVGYKEGIYSGDTPINRTLFYIKFTFNTINTGVNSFELFQLPVSLNKNIVPSKILVDDNYVYISGSTNGYLKTELPDIVYADLFFIRINKQNNTLAENDKFQFSTNGGDIYVQGMKFNSDKTHIYISGNYIGKINEIQSTNFSPYFLNITLENILTPTNSFAFKKVLDTVGADRGQGFYVDGDGNGYIVGYTDGNLPDNQNYLTGLVGEKADIMLVKVDSLGDVVWFKQLGTDKNDEGHGVVIDSTGNIFIVGKTRGELGGPNIVGSWNIFISKLSRRLICTTENNQNCQ